jgi:hypothetical protein
MPLEHADLSQIIQQPTESLTFELKDWIDPDVPEGQAKIVKATLALRNNDGGYLLIGFRDDGSPNVELAPGNVMACFSIDKIQALIARFSSEPFEVFVHFPERDGHQFVLIEVPQGVKTPVVSKSELRQGDRSLVRCDRVFVRTLNANNTPSTAEAKWRDWPDLMERCFENREADVGRFIRRHLATAVSEDLKTALGGLFAEVNSVTPDDRLIEFLDSGLERYETAVRERAVDIPRHGSMEVAVSIEGRVGEHRANGDFLNLIRATNPDYTGWPVWVATSNAGERSMRPYVFEGGWEMFAANLNTGFMDTLDFWRILPEGHFYLYRALQDDINGGERAPEAGTTLDFGLAVLRPAECLAVALTFAKAMGANEDASLKVVFRWRGLQGRRLSSWANPMRFMPMEREARQDEVVSLVDIPVETAPGALAGYVKKATDPLFEIFDGFSLNQNVVEDLVQRLIERRLR